MKKVTRMTCYIYLKYFDVNQESIQRYTPNFQCSQLQTKGAHSVLGSAAARPREEVRDATIPQHTGADRTRQCAEPKRDAGEKLVELRSLTCHQMTAYEVTFRYLLYVVVGGELSPPVFQLDDWARMISGYGLEVTARETTFHMYKNVPDVLLSEKSCWKYSFRKIPAVSWILFRTLFVN